MKKAVVIFALFVLAPALVFIGCNKYDDQNIPELQAEDMSAELSLTNLEPDVVVLGSGEKEDYSEVVVEELILGENCGKEVVSGILEFYFEDEMVFSVDFGNGECDGEATISWLDKNDELRSKVVALAELFRKKEMKRCFQPVFPVTHIMPDGSEIIVESDDDRQLIRQWYQENPDYQGQHHSYVFPVTLDFGDDLLVTVNSAEEMINAMEEYCPENGRGKGKRPDKGKEERRCFVIEMPFTQIMPDGSEITIEEKGDLQLVQRWFQENPDYKGQKPSIVFPVTIIFGLDNSVTVNNLEEMRIAVDENCEGKPGKNKCFELEFPVTHIMPDGTEITIESNEDRQLIRQWYEDNPEYKDEKPSMVFPVTLIFGEDNTITVNNEEELRSAVEENCERQDGNKCFDLVLPVTHIMPDGSELAIASEDDRGLIKAWYEDNPDYNGQRPSLVFPVSLDFGDDNVITVNNKEELEAAVRENCDRGDGKGKGRG